MASIKEKLLYLQEAGITHLVPRGEASPVASSAEPSAPFPPADDDPWEALRREVFSCQLCSLHATKTNYVFGEGDRRAKLMFVGEAPGADEDQEGRPFVGRAGQKLTEMIKAMGFSREEVYIGNIVKCRPPNNATPDPKLRATCFPFLQRQISLIAPQILITLGNVPTQTLLETRDTITHLRGRWGSYKGIPLMPTFHPSYLLRNYTVETRKAVWSDLQLVLTLMKDVSR